MLCEMGNINESVLRSKMSVRDLNPYALSPTCKCTLDDRLILALERELTDPLTRLSDERSAALEHFAHLSVYLNIKIA